MGTSLGTGSDDPVGPMRNRERHAPRDTLLCDRVGAVSAHLRAVRRHSGSTGVQADMGSAGTGRGQGVLVWAHGAWQEAMGCGAVGPRVLQAVVAGECGTASQGLP